MYEKVEKLMEEKGVKVADVAKATGISSSVFTDWKKGRYTPKADKLYALAQYFDVPMEYFFDENDQDDIDDEDDLDDDEDEDDDDDDDDLNDFGDESAKEILIRYALTKGFNVVITFWPEFSERVYGKVISLDDGVVFIEEIDTKGKTDGVCCTTLDNILAVSCEWE